MMANSEPRPDLDQAVTKPGDGRPVRRYPTPPVFWRPEWQTAGIPGPLSHRNVKVRCPTRLTPAPHTIPVVWASRSPISVLP